MNNTHHEYGYNEPQAFKPFCFQAQFEHTEVKNVDVPIDEQQSFRTEAGQPLTDLVGYNFKK